MLGASRRHAIVSKHVEAPELERLERRYGVQIGDIDPRVFWSLVEGWIELTVRFLVSDHGIREVKDRITRDIISGFEQAGIKIATTSYEITELPPLRIERSGPSPSRPV
jgi:hypothetical protein